MAFLEEVCGDDEAMRNRLGRLLEAHQRAGHFLNGGARDAEDSVTGGGECAGGDPLADGDDCAGEDSPADGGDGVAGPAGSLRRIGSYRIIRLIGAGTFSRVYLAEQEEPVRRCVALKIIKAGMDTHEVILRFRRERQVLALMDHPGIAKVFDAGATPTGRPYFAMEWVRGVEITRYCDEHELPIQRRLELFCQVCSAVMHAHQKGVIHRDLKPPNILVGENDGQPSPKIIDFGIVKVTRELARGSAAATWGASLVGTPAYMSPEQAQAGGADVDTRSDVYSLGALLYELLAGHPPYDDRSFLGMTWDNLGGRLRAQDPERPSVRLRHLAPEEQAAISAARKCTPHALDRLLRDDLDWIVLKALERDREARYQSAAEFVEDIRHHIDRLPVTVAARSPTYRLRKLVTRNRHAVAVAAVIVGLLVAGVVVSSRLAVLAHLREQQAQNSQIIAEEAEHDARRRLIEMNVTAGLAANERSDHDDALLWFVHAALAAGKEQQQRATNIARAHNWLTWNAFPVAAFQVPASVEMLQFDPRGERLLTLTADRQCTLWDQWQGIPLAWVGEVGSVAAAAWSPDGSHIGLAPADGPVEIRRVADGGLVERLARSGPATALAFSPDGRYLACGSRRVVLWDLDDRSEVAAWPHPDAVSGIIFSPRSDRLATACGDRLARVFDLAPGPGYLQPIGAPLAHRPTIRMDTCKNKTDYHEGFLSKGHASALEFLDQGRVLVTRSDVYEISMWEISSGRAITRFDRICCSCNSRISADGGSIACGLHGNVVGVWDTGSGQPRGALLPQGGCVFDVAFHPRDDILVAAGADHSATFWSLQTGERIGAQLHHFNDVMSVAFAADGRLVATAQADGLVRIWKAPSPENTGRGLGPDLGPERLRLGGHGRLVVAAKEPAWNVEFRRTRVFDVATGSPAGPVMEFPGTIHDAALSADGRLLAVAVHDLENAANGSLQLHDVATGEQICGPWKPPSAPMALCWHPTEERLALVCRDGELGVARAGSELKWTWLRQQGHAVEGTRFQLAYSADGERLISLASGDQVEVWRPGESARSSKEIPAPEGTIWSFALSKSGDYLATSSVPGHVVVWNLETCEPAGPVLEHPAWVYQAAFSPDESTLVTACHDGQALAWDWRQGTLRCQALEHAEPVMDVDFTPDGATILTACRDGAVRLWDPLGGEIVMPPVKVGQQALSIAVPPDGRHAVIGSLGKPSQVLGLPAPEEARNLSLQDLRTLGEVLSNLEIRDGQRRELSTAEWLERFGQLQQAKLTRFPCLNPTLHDPGATESPGTPIHCGDLPECLDCPIRTAAADLPVTTPGVVR